MAMAVLIRRAASDWREGATRSTRRTASATTATVSSAAKNEGVQRGMRRWVDEFVVSHNICPFAAKSEYAFRIFEGNRVDQGALSFFVQHVLKTGEKKPSAARYSSFLVFPYVDVFLRADDEGGHQRGDMEFMGFYQEAIDSCENYAGTPNMTFTDQQVTVMPFHPDFPKQQHKMQQLDPSMFGGEEMMRSEARLHTTCAPFPTFHILRDSDLHDVRSIGESDISRSVHSLLKRNDGTTKRLGLSKLQQMMADYRGELER